MADLDTLKEQLFKYVALRLGDGIIDIELDPEHYEIAYEEAIGTYRQRAQNSTEESYALMTIQENTDTYQLPQEISTVRQVFRRTVGNHQGPYSSTFDPFSSAALNVYMLNFNYAGGLATYEMYSQYVELAARMFGGFMNYNFNPATKKLQLIRDPRATGEEILLWTYNEKPEVQLLSDPSTSQWIKDYTFASAKVIIGEAREKFSNIAGPQGGGSLNGAQMKNEGQQDKERLVEDLKNYVDASQPLYFVIG